MAVPRGVKLSVGASEGMSPTPPQDLLLWKEGVPEWEEGSATLAPGRAGSSALQGGRTGSSGAAEDAAEAGVDLALHGLAGQRLPIHCHDARGHPRLQAERPHGDVGQVGTVQVQVGPPGHGQEELEQRHAADAGLHVEEVDAAVVQPGRRCHQQVGAQVGLVDGVDQDELLLGDHGPVRRHGLAQRRQQRVGGQRAGRCRPRRLRDVAVGDGRGGVPGGRGAALLRGHGQVGQAALVHPELGQALQRAQGEAGAAQPAVLLAVDVHVRDEAPAKAQEGEEAFARGRAQRHQVHLRVQPLAQDEGAVCQQLFLGNVVIAVRDGESEFGAQELSCCPSIHLQTSPLCHGWDTSLLGDSVPQGQLLGVVLLGMGGIEGTEPGQSWSPTPWDWLSLGWVLWVKALPAPEPREGEWGELDAQGLIPC